MEQRSSEWVAVRVGKITASRIKDLDAKPKAGKVLNAVMLTLLSERLTGQAGITPATIAMQWGIDNEPLARKAYELETFSTVIEVGFIPHPTIAQSGASPDGLVGDDGLIEIKCPNTETHLNTVLTAQAPSEYIPQMQWQMACTGRKWCDFVSFDPRLPKPLFIVRVYRDDDKIKQLEQLVIECNSKLDDLVKNWS